MSRSGVPRKGDRNTKYHIQRVIARAVMRAQDNLILARDSLELLLVKHPEGLDGGWDADDMEQLKLRLDEALKETGDFHFHLS